MRGLRNIYNLGVKELRSLLGDKAMLTLIVFSFTVSVYSSATVTPGSLNLAPIAIADMDQSQLSNRIVSVNSISNSPSGIWYLSLISV